MRRNTLHHQSKLFASQALAGSAEGCMAQVPVQTKHSIKGTDSTHLCIESAGEKTNEATSNEAPSESESQASNSIGLVAHATPLSQVDGPVDVDFDDSKEMLESTTDEKERQYWDRVYDFASDMTEAAKMALLERGKVFRKVVAVIIYWETSTGLEYVRDQADKLATIFQVKFNYEVSVYKLAKDVRTTHFITRISQELDKVVDDEDSMFILYYGGHASRELSNVRSWKKENSPRSEEVSWSTAEEALFRDAVTCSKLFIFDCCQAGVMIDPKLPWESSCELLGACGADVQASAVRTSSFTAAFIEEISNNTYSVCEVHNALCSSETRTKYNLKVAPHYQRFTGHRIPLPPTLIRKVGSPVETKDRPRTAPETLERLSQFSDAVICIAITFKCSAETLMEQLEEIKKDWKRWFKFAPTMCDDIIIKACRGTKLVAAFNSNSCITIWSLPIWLWDTMAPPRGYQYIGIIRSENLALADSGTQSDLAGPDHSSSMMVGGVNLSPQPPDGLPPDPDIPLGCEVGDGDPHPEPQKPHSTTSSEVEATSKLRRKNLPKHLVQSDTDSPERLPRCRQKEELPGHAQLSSSSDYGNPSRTTTFGGPDTLSQGQITLVDFIQDPPEEGKAQKIQSERPTEGTLELSFCWEPEF